MASSLFPHLPGRSRTPFGVGLAIVVVVLGGFALLRWQAAMVSIAAAGPLLLFLVYLGAIDIRRDVRRRSLLMAAVVGIALGVCWAYFAGTVFADGYDVALGSDMDAGPNFTTGLAISIIEGLLMIVPALVVRVLSRSARVSLDGFVVGALGAVAFTAAATVTLLAPQLTEGPVAPDRSLTGLLVEAGIQGVAMPAVSVAVGGIFGIALWFRRPAEASPQWRNVVPAAVLVIVALFVGLGILDVSPISESLYVAGYLVIASVAVLALRIALQAALLNEAHESICAEEQLSCADCDHVVPRMPFCPNCGIATRAASTTSRSSTRVLGVLGAGLAIAAAIAVAASLLMTPGVAPYRCPPECGAPPLGTPVETNPRYSGANGAFSVAYPGEGSAYKATLKPDGLDGIVLDYVGGDTGTLALFGEPARGRSAKDIALALIREKYPDATVDYEIPNTSVGYQPGYGVVADAYPQTSTGRYTRLRVLVMVAVKHDYALIAAGVGPYHRFSPEYGSGHPSGANLELAMDMGKYVNSFKWGGDRFGRGPS